MRFAYADPPYIGQAKRHYGDHADYAGEVDHRLLIERLVDEYPDGWALSLSIKSLQQVIALCPPDVLTLAWVKPVAPPMGDRRHYSWEPVIMRGGRTPQRPVKSHLTLSPPQFTFRERPPEHVIGEKPEGFCHWVFEAAGLLPQDAMDDLFPGSGAVGRAWDTYRAGPLATATSRPCPTCSASPHERCTSLKTGRPSSVHAARATLIESAADQPQTAAFHSLTGESVNTNAAGTLYTCTANKCGWGWRTHSGDEAVAKWSDAHTHGATR